jgi:hypothetical protein
MATMNMDIFENIALSGIEGVNVAPTVEAWLFELKHRRSFHVAITDLSDPYNKAMSTFQAFTNSIIDALERNDVEVVSLIEEGLLTSMYSNYPKFEAATFRLWVKDAMLKHPFRRWPKQTLFLEIVSLFEDAQARNISPVNIKGMVLSAYASIDDRFLDPKKLVKDPDALYFFRNKNGIIGTESTRDSEDNKACPVCTDDFHKTFHPTQRAPCGHVICRRCFDHWLLECKRTYTCPLCRACVVCGANDCKHHTISRDVAPPISMPKLLNRVLPDAAGQELHGLLPIQYWTLREPTRGHRGLLASIEQKLESATVTDGDAVYKSYVKDAERIMEMFTAAVEIAVKDKLEGRAWNWS